MSVELPAVTAKQAARIAERLGFALRRQRGSHPERSSRRGLSVLVFCRACRGCIAFGRPSVFFRHGESSPVTRAGLKTRPYKNIEI